MITFKFAEQSDRKVAAFVGNMEPALEIELRATMERVLFIMTGDIVQNKLSQRGPTTLGIVSGHLASGVQSSAHVETMGTLLRGIIGIPRNVKYGVYHELGAHIPAVDGTLMVFKGADGNMVFTKKRRAFDLPERSFLRSTLRERKGWIIQQLNAGITRTVHNAKS